MKPLLSKVLYYLGDLISKLFYYTPISKYFTWLLYPIYSRLMIWSSQLDKAGVIWKNVEE